MNAHHLILGTITDFITGVPLDDTLDERYRQQIARLLVSRKGYDKSEVHPRIPCTVAAGAKQARLTIDFGVHFRNRYWMVIRFGPGSLVTRHRPALAASRLIAPYQVPVAVVTNGEDADILDGETGQCIARGMEHIPEKASLIRQYGDRAFTPLTEKAIEMASRILYAFEVDGACPCDDTICRL